MMYCEGWSTGIPGTEPSTSPLQAYIQSMITKPSSEEYSSSPEPSTRKPADQSISQFLINPYLLKQDNLFLIFSSSFAVLKIIENTHIG